MSLKLSSQLRTALLSLLLRCLSYSPQQQQQQQWKEQQQQEGAETRPQRTQIALPTPLQVSLTYKSRSLSSWPASRATDGLS